VEVRGGSAERGVKGRCYAGLDSFLMLECHCLCHRLDAHLLTICKLRCARLPKLKAAGEPVRQGRKQRGPGT